MINGLGSAIQEIYNISIFAKQQLLILFINACTYIQDTNASAVEKKNPHYFHAQVKVNTNACIHV